MNTISRCILLILLTAASFSASARHQRDTLGVGSLMTFSENKGQWDDNILFRSQMRAATLFVERDCFTIVLQHPDNATLNHHPNTPSDRHRYRQHAYKVHFENSHADRLTGEQKTDDYENYFIGNNPDRWAGNVGKFLRVRYSELYDGVDLVVYSASNAMKYDFVVAAGADPRQIAMRYEGVDGTKTQDGNIVIKTSVLDIVELKPYAFQIVDGKEQEVEIAYSLKGDRVGFVIGDYDHSKELVIDPYLYFSTYTGATADNWGTTATYDQYKNTYTAGLVFGTGYPVSLGAYDGSFNGNADVGLFVFNPDGTQRLYSTYLGGSDGDMPHSLYVNDLNELIIFGTTGSANFPVTPNAYDTSFNGGTPISYESNYVDYPNGSDIFVCRFNSTGTQLAASTFIGGTANDGLNYENYYNSSLTTVMLGNDSLYFNYGDIARGELITDDLDNVYVGTTTHSANFPVTANSFRPFFSGGQDGIAFKLDYNLSNLLWSSYLGGYRDDAVYSIDVDDKYNLLVCGGTNSPNFPVTAGAYKTSFGGGSADGFVAKISYYGTELMASTFFGSTAYDQCYFVRNGKHNDVFLLGQTKASGSTLIHNANYNTPNSGQFIARMNPELNSLVWSTVFGTGSGEPNISPTAFAADICDRVYAVGWGRKFAGYTLGGENIPWNTYGTAGMPITDDAYQSTTDGQDFYIFSIASDASALIYGSYFGELHSSSNSGGQDHVDGGTSRFDRCATLYQSVCASCGGFDDFPVTSSAWSTTNNANNCNNAVFRFNVSDDFPVADFCQPPSLCAPVNNHTFVFNGRADSVRWDYGDGTSDNGYNSLHYGRHSYPHPGIYNVRVIAYMDTGCKATDTVSHQFYVIGDTSYWLDTIVTCPLAPVQIGMTPILGASYRWIEGAVSDSTIANPYINQSGTYTMLITTTGGCTDTVRQVAILGQSEFTIEGDTNGCSSPITLTVNCAEAGHSFLWSHYADLHDTINPDLSSTTLTFEPEDTAYTLYIHVTDNYGCFKTDSVHIHHTPILDTIETSDITCPGGCDGSAVILHTANGTAPFSYLCDNISYSDSVITDLCAGSHTLTLTDIHGCRVTKTVTLEEPPMPHITHHVTHIHCYEENTGKIRLRVQGPSRYTYEWTDNGSSDSVRTQLAPGVYTVKITDANGCVFMDTAEVFDGQHTFENFKVWADDSVVFVDGTTQLHITESDVCTYHWTPSLLLDDASSANPTATLTDTTVFVVTATDTAGCTYTDSVKVCCIQVDCGGSSLFIPNAFTPNDDGKNDQLCFRSEWVTSFHITIFSRWGEIVYESHDVNECWDGRYKDNMCLPGVYTYYCKITCEANQEAAFKGDITLIR